MRFSASRRRFLDACGYPFGPDVVVDDEPPGPASRIGTQVHGWIEDCLLGEPERSLAQSLAKEEASRARAIYQSWHEWWFGWRDSTRAEWVRAGSRTGAGSLFVPSSLRVEAPMALDLATGESRVLDRSSHRDYGAARETEVVGTADLVAERVSDGRLCVLDWKTGSDAIDAEPQLRTLALIAARLPPHAKVVDAVAVYASVDGVRTKPEPRPGAGSLGWLTFGGSPGSLTEEFYRLRRAFLAAVRGEAPPTINPLCGSYCPARSVCPAWRDVDDAMSGIVGRSRMVEAAK